MPDPVRPTILLVEDNAGDARLIKEALRETGAPFELLWSQRLLDAMQHVARAHVVLLDLTLPDSDGLATLRRVHAAAPDVPVVILTASKDEEAAFKALRQGAQDYIAKDGVEPRALERALRYAMERHAGQGDVDALYRQLAAYDKLASIGTMVAGVAHEVNNPLVYVRNSAENTRSAAERALARPGLAPETRADLEEILRHETIVVEGIERIGVIVRSLKSWARQGPVDRVPTLLNDLVRQALTVAGPRLHGVQVATSLRGTRPVMVNPGAVAQVLLNLVLNAVEAMETQGGGQLSVSVRETEGDAIIEVSDTGPGIPDEAAQRLFTPFFTTKTRGTGLGLSVSRNLVVEHGGELTFQTQAGKGATFTIRLPLAEPATQRAIAAKEMPLASAERTNQS